MEKKNAAHTLDQIRSGGTQLLTVARERLKEVEVALDEGRFQDAAERAQELMQRLAPLANAETFIGAFGESYVVRAEDVTEGVTLRQWGKVSNIEREDVPVPGSDPCVHITLHIEGDDEPKKVHGDQELVALRDESMVPDAPPPDL